MSVTDHAFRIHHTDERHASPLEELYFLPIAQGHLMIWIRQADKRKFLLIPILTKSIRVIRTNGKNLRTAACEFLVLIAQAR